MDLDEFSDDGLDDLPDNALQELENQALQLTQAPRNPPTQTSGTPYPDPIWIEDDDLDTAEVTNDVGKPIGRQVVDNTLQQLSQHHNQHQESRRSIPPPPTPRWNSVVDTSTRRLVGQPISLHPGVALNQPTYTSQQFQTQSIVHRPQASQFARPIVPTNHFNSSQGQSNNAFAALQLRVRKLESDLNVARGEVSITRSKSIKDQELHQAEVARLKKLNAEQLGRQERIAEAAIAAEQSANTELQFLQRDMKEVNDRARRKDAAGSTATASAASIGTTTPKKSTKTWRVSDGFDEMDIVASPSKGQGRNKNAPSVAINVGERTPSKGKRKRSALDSPVMPLDIDMGDLGINEKSEPSVMQTHVVVTQAPALPFEFLQLILDHGSFSGQAPTFEVLSRFSFTSDPNTSFAAYIFKRLPVIGDPGRPIQLLVDFAHVVVDIWNRCLEEQYWEPIKYLVALVAFTLQLQATEVAPLIVSDLAPVAQATVFSLAEFRHRLSDEEQLTNDQFKALATHINIPTILSLLYTTALTCSTAMSETETGIESKAAYFWRYISLDMPSMLLTAKQELPDILGMLDFLATSSLPESIGPITEETDASFVAQLIIDKVAVKLTECPRSVSTATQKRLIKFTALRTLIAFTRHPFGAIQLATHATALPRLVTCLSTSIDELYDQPIPLNILPDLFKGDGTTKYRVTDPSAELCRIISQCVGLIHILVTDPVTANIANISQKLSMAHGGSQRYLLALGRLTFAEEDLVMESGIDEEIIEAAHELLELVVTPDEGEIVSEAFGA